LEKIKASIQLTMKQLLLSKLKATGQKVESISKQAIPDNAKLIHEQSLSGENLWDKILAENNGKVIYLDIWATWCSPCKKLIPHSQRMHEKLKDEGISFAYLCGRSKRETWENVIREYQIEGTHVLLSREQYNYMINKFSISGIPHYILINQEGTIIDSDAPRPDSEKIYATIKSLIRKE